MLPVIKEGDQISIELFPEPQPIGQRPIGEIVVFKDEGQWVTHRVIQFKEKKYTKGDWSYCIDLERPAWGRVVAINGSEKRIKRGELLAKLSTVDLFYTNSFVRRLRKVFSLILNYV